jgi:hypothetical protein
MEQNMIDFRSYLFDISFTKILLVLKNYGSFHY